MSDPRLNKPRSSADIRGSSPYLDGWAGVRFAAGVFVLLTFWYILATS